MNRTWRRGRAYVQLTTTRRGTFGWSFYVNHRTTTRLPVRHYHVCLSKVSIRFVQRPPPRTRLSEQ